MGVHSSMGSAGIKLTSQKGEHMKYLALLLLSLPCWADSISLPATGYLWVDRNPADLSQVAYTVSNLGFGEYTADETIYSLQFSSALPSPQFFYKAGGLAFTGTFSNWSFSDGLFVGTFSGFQLNYSTGSWSLLSMSSVAGVLSQQLTLIPGCFGLDSGCGTVGAGWFALDHAAPVPEPATLTLFTVGLVTLAGPALARFGMNGGYFQQAQAAIRMVKGIAQ